MDDATIFSRHHQHFQDITDLFKALIKFRLKISPNKCHFFREQLAYMDPKFMLKDGKPLHTPMREKCDAVIKLKAPKSVQDCGPFRRMVMFCYSSSETQKHFIPIYELQKKAK